MLIPKIIITDAMGWYEIYTEPCVLPSHPELNVNVLAPSFKRVVATRSCLRVGRVRRR